jgi:Holliday junction resolvase RusA-like endonuclease
MIKKDENILYQITIPLPPRTKKNSQQIILNKKTKKPMIVQSTNYLTYERDCRFYIKFLYGPIKEPVNIKALYYMPTKRKVDLVNLHSALHDILVTYRVLEDDDSKIIKGTDGSRVLYDKKNPRTEVLIERFF